MKTTISNVSEIRPAIEASIPVIEKHNLRAPAKFDGASVPHYGFFRADNGHCLSYAAKSGYEMTTHDDYAALSQAAIDAMGGSGQIQANWTERKSVAQATIIVSPTDQERRDNYRVNGADYIFPRLIIRAPFGRPFSVTMGFYRDLCRNLDIAQLVGQSFSQSIRHTSQLTKRIEELTEICRNAGDFGAMVDNCRRMSQIEVDTAEFLSRLYPLADDASQNTRTRAEGRAAAIYARIRREQLAVGNSGDMQTTNLWQMVQAITGYVQHDKSRKNGIGNVDRAIVGLDDAENAAAWSRASELLAAA